ncbi:phosphoribosylformylglycinamidine synthase subunit PurQ [Liberibacter crescens]|uniref:phosphoribosylformylglycinamidine synthase subunit PurQ n=1 Tax=Liberibacter crescens TaxID=1273132 RepID=UPI0005A21D94|nr:phosphoribosylformylglycinamidine synthase subunit PurQ [Liberibacter crescens]AMC13340.1 phosphoribosylformylglycinamidine synthase [Liberibacter crescens]
MKTAVIQLPGLNRDRDMIVALEKISGITPLLLWETDTDIPNVDLIVIPGGFSYGDYMRCGAIAARTPVIQSVKKKIEQGIKVIGICNGFQILLEAGILPGALMRNASLKFVCKEVLLEVTNAETSFTRAYTKGQIIRCPVAHHDGNYFADEDTLHKLKSEGLIVFRYASETNPNGSLYDIAGIINSQGNVLGMMPHPENMIESATHGGKDGYGIFDSVLNMILT